MSYHDEIEREITSAIKLGGGHSIARADHGELKVEVTEADSMAISFESFEFVSDRLANASTKRLSEIADNLARKLTYLLEPLRVIEVDGDAGAVQMRSHPPYQQSGQTRYYEVLVQRGGTLSLVRYERRPGESRMPIPATVTHEVFYRLADDFATAAE
jgi:hypothetical protein